MGELGALFNPGMRHEQEERRAKALRREEEGNSRDVDPRIDLESGVAVITTGDHDSPGEHDSTGPSGAGDEQPAGADPAPAAAPTAPNADHTASAADSASDAKGGDDDAVAPSTRPRPRGKRGLAARSR